MTFKASDSLAEQIAQYHDHGGRIIRGALKPFERTQAIAFYPMPALVARKANCACA